ncbi:MAG: hypothetical protein O7E55_03945 [Chloroflexi bacterium]|nr:hypothetical protein [Chloroflexota bacterium]
MLLLLKLLFRVLKLPLTLIMLPFKVIGFVQKLMFMFFALALIAVVVVIVVLVVRFG